MQHHYRLEGIQLQGAECAPRDAIPAASQPENQFHLIIIIASSVKPIPSEHGKERAHARHVILCSCD
ncbi:unnamed protein product, partial [Iphiclides podalirius]